MARILGRSFLYLYSSNIHSSINSLEIITIILMDQNVFTCIFPYNVGDNLYTMVDDISTKGCYLKDVENQINLLILPHSISRIQWNYGNN